MKAVNSSISNINNNINEWNENNQLENINVWKWKKLNVNEIIWRKIMKMKIAKMKEIWRNMKAIKWKLNIVNLESSMKIVNVILNSNL
jgi:hypothetical protein